MQIEVLSAIEKDLYPFDSHHQQEITGYFGESLCRELTADEIALLGQLDIFLVVFTNRCGSTFLTEIMHQAGLPVPPRSEVFNSDSLIPVCEEHDIGSLTDYFVQVVSGWGKGGRVGFKIGARQLFWFTRLGLLSHFNSVRIINSRRRDRVGQAVSLYIARQTGQWHSRMQKVDAPQEIPYSREGVLSCLRSIHEDQQLFEYYVDIHTVPAINVDYEETLSQPDRELSRIADFLGYTLDADTRVDTGAIGISRQSDEENRRLIAQFKREFS